VLFPLHNLIGLATLRSKYRKFRNKIKTSKIPAYLCFATFGVLFLREKVKENRLHTRKLITSCQVIQFSTSYKRSGVRVNFVYVINGKQYGKNDMGVSVSKPAGNLLVNTRFPVVLDSTDFSNCRILVTPRDFDHFNLPFPDSLEWVRQFELDP
jgi:hypothetical protein